MSVDGKGYGVTAPGIQQADRARSLSVGDRSDVVLFAGREVRQAADPPRQRPRSNSAQLPSRPLGDWHVEIGPGTPEAAAARRAIRQGRFGAALNTQGTAAEVRAAAAGLTSTIPASQIFAHARTLEPSFAQQLRTQYASGTRSTENFTAALDGLLDGLKAIGGGTLSKDDISTYVAFASHLPDMGSMESAQRSNLCLSRLAMALGADANALVVEQNAASSVGETMASTIASLGKVLNDKRPQEAADLFAATLSNVNTLDRQPLLDGVLTRLMTQHGTLGEQGFKALAGGLLQGSGVREAGATEGARHILDALVRCAAAQYQPTLPAGAPVVPAALPAVLDFCKVLGQELHHLGRDPLRLPEEDARLEDTITRNLQPPASQQAVQAFRNGRAESRPVAGPADPPLGPPPDVKAQSANDKRVAQAKSQYDALMDRITNNPHEESAQHLMSDIIACAVKLHKVDSTWPTKLMAAMRERLGGNSPDKALVTMCLNKFAHAALNETLNPQEKDNWELLTDTEKQELESRNFFSSKAHRSLGVDNDETVLRSLMDGFTQALGGAHMSKELRTHCLKTVTHLDYLTLDEPQVVARLFRGLGYKIEEDGPKGRAVPAEVEALLTAGLLTNNERDKILVATKLCPVDWKRDPSAVAKPAVDPNASANQPAASAASAGANSITSKLTQHIGQGRAFQAGGEMVAAHRSKSIKPDELKPMAKQIVTHLYEDPNAWRERVDAFMKGWAKEATANADDDDDAATEILSAMNEAAKGDGNAQGAQQSAHRKGFMTLVPHVLQKDDNSATTAMNHLAAGGAKEDIASWRSFITPDSP